jgi:hypothetical protein
MEFACLPCYPGNTLLSAPRAAWKGWVGAIQIPKFIIFIFLFIKRPEYEDIGCGTSIHHPTIQGGPGEACQVLPWSGLVGI